MRRYAKQLLRSTPKIFGVVCTKSRQACWRSKNGSLFNFLMVFDNKTIKSQSINITNLIWISAVYFLWNCIQDDNVLKIQSLAYVWAVLLFLQTFCMNLCLCEQFLKILCTLSQLYSYQINFQLTSYFFLRQGTC